MSRNKWIAIISVVAMFSLVLSLRFIIGGFEDSWICVNNSWVKHGNPSSSKPNSPCGEKSEKIENNDKKVSIANPASLNCNEKGGKLILAKMGNGGQYGICSFINNKECEEWALFRGDCPAGGVTTAGINKPEEKYCLIIGGENYLNDYCEFKDGSFCDKKDLFNGLCKKGDSNK